MPRPLVLLDRLELRQLLSATIVLDDRTLRITGTPDADSVAFASNGFQVTVRIETTASGGGGQSVVTQAFVESDVQRFSIDLGDGNDSVTPYGGSFGPKNRRAMIVGGAGDDYLIGGHGNDRIDGGDGNDTLLGGEGNDQLNGGRGRDWIEGGFGDDHASGDAGDDSLFGDSGNDRLYGATGNDRLYGGTGADRLSGGADDDALFGGDAADALFGGTGDDRLLGEGGRNRLDGGHGVDRGNTRGRSHDNVLVSIEGSI